MRGPARGARGGAGSRGHHLSFGLCALSSHFPPLYFLLVYLWELHIYIQVPGPLHAPNKQPGSPSRVEAAALGSLACLPGDYSFCCLSGVGEVRDPTITLKSYFFFVATGSRRPPPLLPKPTLPPPPDPAPSRTCNRPRAFLPLGCVTPVRSL